MLILSGKNKQSLSALTVRQGFCGRYWFFFLNGYFADSFVSVFFVEFFSLEGIYIASKELQINEEIRDAEVRVISDSGEQLGIMSGKEAYNVAVDRGLDLVKISPNAQPPVCKIMDYGKYKFELAKREKENRKNQKVVNTKEVQLSPSIDTNDFNTKCNHAIRFLKNGDKVKVSVRFRGREISHSEMGETLLLKFADNVKEFGNMDKAPKLEGRNMVMFLVPLA